MVLRGEEGNPTLCAIQFDVHPPYQLFQLFHLRKPFLLLSGINQVAVHYARPLHGRYLDLQ